MADLTRFGISIDERLLSKFDEMINEKGYVNRSEAIRDLIRAALVEEEWGDENQQTVATVTLVYDHHTRDLSDKLTEHQHSHHEEIVSTLHVHLDHHHCLEVVVIKGLASRVKRIADELIGTKGVKHGKLVTTTSGQNLL
jgi:CopG family nickel-responsive transcriptional regulator